MAGDDIKMSVPKGLSGNRRGFKPPQNKWYHLCNCVPWGTEGGLEKHIGSSYLCCYLHIVFSTKERKPTIMLEWKNRLWEYLGGITRDNKMKLIKVGGTQDHTHILISMPSTLSTAKALQFLKGGSSRWIHETFPLAKDFAWQDGYGAFSVSPSKIEDVKNYIAGQEEHHGKRSFEEEFRNLLKKHGIEFDERYIWG